MNLKKLLITNLLLGFSFSINAQTIVDILDRKVTIDGKVEKVILGEGRFITTLGILDVEEPLEYVAGMLNEFRAYDPSSFEQYKNVFPEIDNVPNFGQTSEDSVSIEKIIALNPDVAIFGIQGHGPKSSSKMILDTLEAADIPVVFIDFRQHPLLNTARSIEIIGELLGYEEQAKTFSAFYNKELNKITSRLSSQENSCPTVLLEIRVGIGAECCYTIAQGMFAEMIKQAGGCNIATGVIPTAAGQLNLEYVVSTAPDIYIGTAVGTAKGSMAGKGRIILGAGVDEQTARSSLQSALQRPGIATLPAIENKRAHAIWHHFYNSPLNLYAIQQFAKWFHPELFEDIDPNYTLAYLLNTFDPVDLSGVYSISLK